MRRVYFILISIFFVISCDGNTTDSKTKSKSNLNKEEIEEYFNSMSYFKTKVEVSKSESQDLVTIEVVFLNNNDSINWIEDNSPYFLDIPTKEFITKLFLYDYYTDLKQYEDIRMYLNFQGNGTDHVICIINRSDLEDAKKYFKNPLFLENSRASISNITYDEMLVFRKFMNELVEIVPEYNIKNPNYWDCLYGFSNYLIEKDKEHEEYALIFMDLIWAMNEYLGEEEFSKEFNEDFFTLVKCNNIDPDNIERSRSAILELLKSTKPSDYKNCFDDLNPHQ